MLFNIQTKRDDDVLLDIVELRLNHQHQLVPARLADQRRLARRDSEVCVSDNYRIDKLKRPTACMTSNDLNKVFD